MEDFLRILYKPDSQTLWGFHNMVLPRTHIETFKDESSFFDHNSNSLATQDEENDVDMNSTMWLVLRKTRPTNETLKKFFADMSSQPIRVKDIVKFGRVNFKVSALFYSKLNDDLQQTYEQVTSNALQSNVTQQNLLTQNDINRHQQSSVSILHTEMNNLDNTPNHAGIN